MKHNRIAYALIVALAGTVALAGCKKKEEAAPAPTPVVTEPAPVSAPAPMAATASVVSVDLGSAVGPDSKVTTPTTIFTPKDTVYAAVSTTTSDPVASVAGKLSAKWTFQDGQTVHKESKDFNLAGPGVTTFHVNKPDGFPAGKYKVEVSLDGVVTQSKDFEVK